MVCCVLWLLRGVFAWCGVTLFHCRFLLVLCSYGQSSAGFSKLQSTSARGIARHGGAVYKYRIAQFSGRWLDSRDICVHMQGQQQCPLGAKHR
jgi:hypothetical protein